jgi:hypothetical protein
MSGATIQKEAKWGESGTKNEDAIPVLFQREELIRAETVERKAKVGLKKRKERTHLEMVPLFRLSKCTCPAKDLRAMAQSQ